MIHSDGKCQQQLNFPSIFLWIDPLGLTSPHRRVPVTLTTIMASLTFLFFGIIEDLCLFKMYSFSFHHFSFLNVDKLELKVWNGFFSLKNCLTWCKIHRFISKTYLETLSIGKILQNLHFPALYCSLLSVNKLICIPPTKIHRIRENLHILDWITEYPPSLVNIFYLWPLSHNHFAHFYS